MDRPATPGEAPGLPPASTLMRPEVRVAGRGVEVTWAGLAPCCAGLYQVNVKLPGDLAAGSLPLQISAGGVASNEARLAVTQ